LLTPGFFGRLRLFGGEHDGLLLPDSAIASDQANKIVLTVADDGTVGVKRVEIGPMIHGLRLVRSGLRRQTASSSKGCRARGLAKVKAEDGKVEAPVAQASQ
jgi:multidrug efflux pump subunit AcrA (membrane-fusion protein)